MTSDRFMDELRGYLALRAHEASRLTSPEGVLERVEHKIDSSTQRPSRVLAIALSVGVAVILFAVLALPRVLHLAGPQPAKPLPPPPPGISVVWHRDATDPGLLIADDWSGRVVGSRAAAWRP